MGNQYDLAIDTLTFYFDFPIKKAIKNLPDPETLVHILSEKGADHPAERVSAVEWYATYFGALKNSQKPGVEGLAKSFFRHESPSFPEYP